MRRFEVAILLAALMLGTSPSLAGPLNVSAAKTKEFHEAYAAYDANDAAKAYRILVPFVANNPAYDAVGLLGQCELVLEKYRDAAEHLAYAIRNTPDGKAANTIPGLKEELADAKTKIATLRITVDQSDAEVTIGDRLLGKSPIDEEVFAEPGKLTIKATHPTHGKSESTLDVKAGEERAVALKLEQAPNTGTPPTVAAATLRSPSELDKPSKLTVNPPPPMEKHDGVETRTVVLIAGTVVTVLAGGAATYFGLKARSARDDGKSLGAQAIEQFGSHPCSTSTGKASDLCADIYQKGQDQTSAGRAANLSLAITGTAAVLTGIAYWVWPSSKEGIGGRATVVPVADQYSRGVVFRGSF